MTGQVEVLWLPLGAGDNTHCVRANGLIFEAIAAGAARRPRCPLFHSALRVKVDSEQFVIEMAPVWSAEGERGVVAEGPVGLRLLGRSRLFRYEVRRWRDGVIPDAAEAVDGPVVASHDHDRASALLRLVPEFPTATWGRDELRAGEMWNSNSLVSWLLARSGHRVDLLRPPDGGRAPGWSAGVVVAAR